MDRVVLIHHHQRIINKSILLVKSRQETNRIEMFLLPSQFNYVTIFSIHWQTSKTSSTKRKTQQENHFQHEQNGERTEPENRGSSIQFNSIRQIRPRDQPSDAQTALCHLFTQ